jgi:hypothetical protein
MRTLWIVFGLIGLLHLLSAATPGGLMPSGHGPGVFSEIVSGLLIIGYACYRITKKTAS